jgi:hypothetical protein
MRRLLLISVIALGLAAPASAARLPTTATAATVDDDGPARLAKRKKKSKKARKKKKSKRERKKEAEEAKRKAAEEAAAQAAAKRAAEEEAARVAAEEEATRKAAEEEAARVAALPVVAVLPLGGTEVALSDLGALNDALRGALDASGQFRLQEQKTTNELVAASQSLGVDCASASERCADQLGALAGASYAVVGQVIFMPPADANAPGAEGASASILNATLGVHLALLPVGDVEGLKPARRVRGQIANDPAVLGDNLRPLLNALLDREQRLGELKLSVQPEGAAVAVDGLALGTAPVAAPGGLLPGAHTVRVTRDGYLPRELTVQVAAAPQEVTVLLEEDPELLKERSIAWWEIAAPWSVFAVGAAAALGGAAAMAFAGVLVLLAGQAYGTVETLNRDAATYPQDAANSYQQNKVFRDLYGMVGPYALVGGGVFLAFGSLLAVSGAGWGSYYFVVARTAE